MTVSVDGPATGCVELEMEGEMERLRDAWGRRGGFLNVTNGAGEVAVDMQSSRSTHEKVEKGTK